MAAAAGDGPARSGRDDPRTRAGSLPSPLDSLHDMRATAKWMLVAAGAVGATLVSGGPLAAVGHVHGLGHSFQAWLGLVIALGGVGLAMWFTGQVLVPRLTTPDTVRTSPDLAALREQIAAEPAEFMGFSAISVDGLFRRQDLLREKAAGLMLQVVRAGSAEQRARLQAELRQVQDNRQVVEAYVRWVLALGHAWLVRADLERSRRWTLVAGVIVAFGAVLFFTATGGPVYVPVLTPSPSAPAGPAAPGATP